MLTAISKHRILDHTVEFIEEYEDNPTDVISVITPHDEDADSIQRLGVKAVYELFDRHISSTLVAVRISDNHGRVLMFGLDEPAVDVDELSDEEYLKAHGLVYTKNRKGEIDQVYDQDNRHTVWTWTSTNPLRKTVDVYVNREH